MRSSELYKALQDFTIPDSVKELTIDDWAFENYSGLEAFKIPESVKTLYIGKQASVIAQTLQTLQFQAVSKS